jgi:hypothetical protein
MKLAMDYIRLIPAVVAAIVVTAIVTNVLYVPLDASKRPVPVLVVAFGAGCAAFVVVSRALDSFRRSRKKSD